jgi:hypothetical protein
MFLGVCRDSTDKMIYELFDDFVAQVVRVIECHGNDPPAVSQ